MTASFDDNQKIWETRYQRGEAVNRYPYNRVVSFVLREFAEVNDRGAVRILDYGCGGGNHSVFLAQSGFDYVAVDYSPTALARVVDTFTFHGLEPDTFRLLCAEFGHLPFRDECFDAVIDRQSLDQNSHERLPALVEEIHRILKPGGIYFGINFSTGHPQLRFGSPLEHGDYTDFSCGTFRGIGSRHFFSVDEIKSLFRRFEIRDIRIMRTESVITPGTGSEELIVEAIRRSD